jgi:hypothetical protein
MNVQTAVSVAQQFQTIELAVECIEISILDLEAEATMARTLILHGYPLFDAFSMALTGRYHKDKAAGNNPLPPTHSSKRNEPQWYEYWFGKGNSIHVVQLPDSVEVSLIFARLNMDQHKNLEDSGWDSV